MSEYLNEPPGGAETVLDGAECAVVALVLVDAVELALVHHVQHVQHGVVERGVLERVGGRQQETAGQSVQFRQVLVVAALHAA